MEIGGLTRWPSVRVPAWRWMLPWLLVAAGCVGGTAPTTTAPAVEGPGAGEVVADLVAAVHAGDFEAAAALTVVEQMPWVVMAEGGSLAEAIDLSSKEQAHVAVNYWQGFSDATELPEPAGSVEEMTVGGRRYAVVSLDSRLQLVLRYDQAWRVDVIASFAPTIANRLLEAAEVVKANRGTQAQAIREMLAAQRPSVEVAARSTALPDATREDLTALLDVLLDLAG